MIRQYQAPFHHVESEKSGHKWILWANSDSSVSDNNRERSPNSAMHFALHINLLVLSRKQEYAEVDEHLKSNSVLDLKYVTRKYRS